MAQPPRRPSNAQRAAEQLRAMILDAELPPGASYLETELAERLGMSRTPVREALLVLEGQGLVEMRPRRGARIRALSADDMREIYEVLTELECLAAGRAARARPDAAALAPLTAAIDAMDAALGDGPDGGPDGGANGGPDGGADLAAWAAADEAFHAELMRLGGNRRAEATARMFSDQVRRARMLTLPLRPPPRASNRDHRALVEAIARGDADAARTLHRRHRTAACALLADLLARHGLRRV